MPNFVLQTPSLQHLAGIKAAAALWNQRNILKQIAEQAEGVVKVVEQVWMKWKGIAEIVKANASALDMTEVCKKQLINFIYPLQVEIFKWCAFHYMDDGVFLNCLLPKQFNWTMHGVVDYAKTVAWLLKDGRVDIKRRYELACINGLEDEARHLIQFIPESKLQEHMRRDRACGRSYKNLIVFFTCTLRGDVDHLISSFQGLLTQDASIYPYLFIEAVHSLNPAMGVYFFNKLTQENKEFVLGREMASKVFASCTDFPHCNLQYYLSQMNEEQREALFRGCMGNVLICLLRWPSQSLFMEAAERGWRYIVYGDYEKVLGAIADRIRFGKHCEGYNYSQLFGQFWRLTPAEVKQSLYNNVEFLKKIFETKNKEIVYLLYIKAPLHQISALEDDIDANDRDEFQLVKEKCIRIKDHLEELSTRRRKIRRLV